jgi:hypothetical protein
VDNGGVERAIGEMHFANETAAGVHEDGIKMFDLVWAAFFPQKIGNGSGRVELGRGVVNFRCHSAGEREGTLQSNGFVAPDAFDGLQFSQRGLG